MEDIEKIISEKVLTERLRQMADNHLIERTECYGYPPRVEAILKEKEYDK